MNIGMTLPVMEPGLTRNNLYEWTNQIDKGPWSSIALGERIVFDAETLQGRGLWSLFFQCRSRGHAV